MNDFGLFGALLFDMDGTILTSIAAAERVWSVWARRHGIVDVEAFLSTIHGRRTVETIATLRLPGVDPEVEAEKITRAEIEDVKGVEAISGVAAFLSSLPLDRWAIVTSAPRILARRRIEAAGLPIPSVLITADDVSNGKPAPDCFLAAAERLSQKPQDCLVFEDTTAGVQAAEAAGARVLIVTAAHKHPLRSKHASVESYEGLVASIAQDGRVRVELTRPVLGRAQDHF